MNRIDISFAACSCFSSRLPCFNQSCTIIPDKNELNVTMHTYSDDVINVSTQNNYFFIYISYFHIYIVFLIIINIYIYIFHIFIYKYISIIINIYILYIYSIFQLLIYIYIKYIYIYISINIYIYIYYPIKLRYISECLTNR